MNSPHDSDDQALREIFARQRAEDHAAAPVWTALNLRSPSKEKPSPVWLWPALAATACVLCVLPFLKSPAPAKTDLSSLPPLMPHVSEPSKLLPDTSDTLSLAYSASPTDFLLPTHLNIDIL